MNRRELIAGGATTLVGCTCGAIKPSLASSPVQGCRLAVESAGEGPFWNLRRDTSGNPNLDQVCAQTFERLTSRFKVRPGFCFYDDSAAKNAVADPTPRFPDRPDGTIMFGVGLLKDEAKRWGDLGGTDLAVQVIMAHEFAHIFQFRIGGATIRDRWEWEPHADFMAGWFLGDGDLDRTGFPKLDFTNFFGLSAAIQSIFEKGDSEFKNPDHHGQQEFRAAMVRAGYFDSKLDLYKAFLKGAQIAGITTSNIELPVLQRP